MRLLTRILLPMALLGILFTSCGNRQKNNVAESATESVSESVTDQYHGAINKYLTDVIGKGYATGELTIPYSDYCSIDNSSAEDIQVWGDFWVENYNVSGDSLLFVSGGNHSGKMHIKKASGGQFFVVGFDAVGDGSEYLPTAKAIFGDRFEEFQKAYSDNEAREEIRKAAIAKFVKKNNLAVKYYKDYGWPAVQIPSLNE